MPLSVSEVDVLCQKRHLLYQLRVALTKKDKEWWTIGKQLVEINKQINQWADEYHPTVLNFYHTDSNTGALTEFSRLEPRKTEPYKYDEVWYPISTFGNPPTR